MRILFIKVAIPLLMGGILIFPFLGVLFFIAIAFVRLEVLTWNMVDARFALTSSVLTLIAWIFHGLIRQNRRERARAIPVQYWLYLLVVLMICLTTLTAEASVDASWSSAQKFLKYAVFLYLMIQMINTEARLRMVQEVIFWGVNFLVIWGIDQYFRGNYRLEKVGGGDFQDSSGLAALFLLWLPCVIYRLYHPNRTVRLTGLFFAPLYVIALTFTESRSGFLGLLAALGLMFLREKRKLRYVVAGLVIGMATLPIMPDSFFERMKTITSGTKEGEERERSADQRVKVWTVAVEVIKDHPALGVGRNNFGRIHHQYAYPIWYGQIPDELYADLFLRYRVCHNLWLDLLVSNGLMTFIPWLILVLSVPYSGSKLRARLDDRLPVERYWIYQTHGLEAGILAYLVTGTFQDLAEVEVFYWAIMIGGITTQVIGRRAWIRETRGRTGMYVAPRARAASSPPAFPPLPGAIGEARRAPEA